MQGLFLNHHLLIKIQTLRHLLRNPVVMFINLPVKRIIEFPDATRPVTDSWNWLTR